MAIVKLQYPGYDLFSPAIAQKVVLHDNNEDFYIYSLIYGFGSFSLKEFYGYESLVLSDYKYIIGTATGRYRLHWDGYYYIEVILFNHFWAPCIGLPLFYVALQLPKSTFINTPGFKFYDLESAELKGYPVLKDHGNRGARGSSHIGQNKGFGPGYFQYSDPKRWDDFFEYTPRPKFGEATEGYLELQNLGEIEKIGRYVYQEADNETSKPLLGYNLQGFYDGYPATYVELATNYKFMGAFPFEYKFIAHKTDPEATLETVGAIVSVDGPLDYNYQSQGYPIKYNNSIRRLIYGLEPGETYFIRTVYKCHDFVEDTYDTRQSGVDTSTETIIYSDAFEYTTPIELLNPLFIFPGKHEKGSDYIRARVRTERLGDLQIKEIGVCAVAVSANRAPVITDNTGVWLSNPEPNTLHEGMVEDVFIPELLPNTEYWLRIYVKLQDNTILYQQEEPEYMWLKESGYRLDKTRVDGEWRAYVKTKPAEPALGKITINEFFWTLPTRVSCKITVDSYGNLAENLSELYMSYSKNPTPSPSDNRVYLDMTRGWDEPTYVDIVDLDPGVEYYISAVITNSVGTYRHTLSTKTEIGLERKLAFETLDALNITVNTAVIRMSLNDNPDATRMGLCWIEGSSTPTISDSKHEVDANVGILSHVLTALKASTVYTFRGYVIREGIAIYSQPVTFKTKEPVELKAPTLIFVEIGESKTTSVDCKFNITSNGGTEVTESGLVYSTIPIDVAKDPSFYSKVVTNPIVRLGNFNLSATGLTPNQTYYVRGFAKNNKGVSYTSSEVFVTKKALTIPVVETYNAYVLKDYVSIGGGISGTEKVTRVGAAWSTSPFSGVGSVDSLGVSFEDNPYVPLSYDPAKTGANNATGHQLKNLAINTQYYYRIYAQNEAGWGWGEQKTFTTLNPNAIETLELTEVVNRGQNSLSFTVEVNSDALVLEYGYVVRTLSTANSAPETIVLGRDDAGEFQFDFIKTTEGFWGVKAYAKTQSKIAYTPEYSLEITGNQDSNRFFNPPTDSKVTTYEFTANGITRRWSRNTIDNAWVLTYDSRFNQPSTQQSTRLSQQATRAQETIVLRDENVEIVPDYHTAKNVLWAPESPSYGSLLIYLAENVKFYIDESGFTPALDLHCGDIHLDGQALYWLEDQKRLEISVVREVPINEAEEELLAIVNNFNAGFTFKISLANKEDKNFAKFKGDAKVKAEDVYSETDDQTLDEKLNWIDAEIENKVDKTSSTTADLNSSENRRYVTEAEKLAISNLPSDTNTAISTEANLRTNADSLLQTQIEALASGTPKGSYPTLVALEAAFPTGTTGIYIVAADGHWYYWDETEEEWADGGAYQAALDVVGERSQSTTTVPMSKLLDDELKKITDEKLKAVTPTYQGVPYLTTYTNMIYVKPILQSDFTNIKFGLSDYVNFKFRFVGSDTISPNSVSTASAFYQADTVLSDATVMEKPYIWLQILRVDGGNLTPSDLTVYHFLGLDDSIEKLASDIDGVNTIVEENKSLSISNDYDYINLIPDNAFQSGIDFFSNQPSTGESGVTFSKADFANPYSRYSLRAVGVNLTGTQNWVGIDYDISSVLKESDTLVFSGLIYPTYSGAELERRIKNATGTTIETLTKLNLTANQWNEIEFEAILPADAAKINLFVRPITQNESVYLAAWDIHKKPSGSILPKISVPIPSESQKTVYVNSSTGSDSNDGSASTPFATISKALTLLTTIQDLSVVISGGDYRETLALSTFTKGRLSIHGKMNETVRILGSTKITGFAKTAGLTNVYDVAFSATINADKPVIFEDGRASLPILEEERHALQKSNTHRLPYSKLTAVAFNTDLATTLATLDATAGSYYRDTTGGKLYIHTSDSNDPTTNGYSYEYAVRGGITAPALGSSSELSLTNISFYFSNTYGINVGKFGNVKRQFVCVFGSSNNGIEDASSFVVSYNDEVADTRDGMAGTHDITSNNRQRNNVTYIGAWSHDNTDDGTSHHSKANVKTIGCLFEYNGKSGIAPSNTCQWTDINSICRKNGGNPSFPLWGEGVEVINPILTGDNGIGCTFTGFGTICEGNRIGFAVQISAATSATLHNCVSRNNTFAEYYANAGKLYANNCKATNSDPLKLKVTAAGGTITVVNDSDLT